MPKKIYCTLDTETLNGIQNPKQAYHLGGLIHTRDGQILASFNYLVASLYDAIRDDDYAKKNFFKYARMVEDGECTMVASVDDAIAAINALCEYYEVTTIMAFNSGFDIGRGACAPLADEREFIDLWLMALETVCQKKSYAAYCRKNGFKSASGKTCRTNVEAVYGYLHNNPEFTEEHTAFSDAKQEMEIFLACQRMHKSYTRNVHCHDYENVFFLYPRWKENKKRKHKKKG